jgi:hypothetical protein
MGPVLRVTVVLRKRWLYCRNFVFFQSHTGFAKYDTGRTYERFLCNQLGLSHNFINVRAQRYRCKAYNESDFTIVPSAINVQEMIDYREVGCSR